MKVSAVRRTAVPVVALGLLLSAALSACGGDDGGGGADGDTLRVVYVAGTTGLFAVPGNAVKRGLEAHVAALNEAGGIDGKQVELVVKDDQSDPTRGVTLLQEEFTSGKPDLVVPGSTSAESLAMAPLLERNDVVGIGVAASPVLDDLDEFPNYFSTNGLQSEILQAAASYLAGQSGVDKVALVVADDALGEAVTGGFSASMEAASVDYSVHTFKADSVDVTATFQQALDEDPDWIYMDGSGDQVARMLEGRVKAGAEDVLTIAGGAATGQINLFSIAQPGQLDLVHAALLPVQAYVDPADRGEQFTTMLDAISAQGELETGLFSYAHGWEVIRAWAAALEEAGTDASTDELIDTLETLPESEDPQFPIMRAGWTPESHFPHPPADAFVFSPVVGFEDGMYVTGK